jgi:hypothetical protein
MKNVQHSYVGIVSIALMLGATFAACGGLDARKVSRGPEDSVEKGGEGNTPRPGDGGADNAAGGGDSNPFGGDKGYEGGAPPVIDGPPTVVAVDPASDAEDADPNDNIGLRFSEGLDPATVTLDNVKIMDGETEVSGELSYEGIDALFEPTRRLSLLATYDITATTGITDAAGTAMAAAFTSKFTVRDGVWGAVADAFPEDGTAYGNSQRSATDGRGNMLVVWTAAATVDGVSTSQVWSRWYRQSGGWQDPMRLDDSPAGSSAYVPAVAASPEGDAVCAWYEYADTGNKTKARRFVNGAWEPTPLDVAPLSAPFQYQVDAPAVAIGAGQVLVSWLEQYYVESNKYDTQACTATTLDGAWPDYYRAGTATYSNSESLQGLKAAITSEGTAISITNYVGMPAPNDPYGPGIHYTRRTAEGAWSSSKISGSLPANNYSIALASAADGAMATWVDYASDTQTYRLLASRYTRAKGFAAPVPIQDPELTGSIALDSANGTIASDGATFFVVFNQTVSVQNTYATKFDIASGKWDGVPTLLSSGESNTGSAVVGVDTHGNALAAFAQERGAYEYTTYSARFRASTGEWAQAQPATDDTVSAVPTAIGVAENGIASLLYYVPAFRSVTGGKVSIFK